MKYRSRSLLTLGIILFRGVLGAAQHSEQACEKVKPLVDQQSADLLKLYKHFHTHPELSFQEAETSARVGEELTRLGFKVSSHIGGYGVVGMLSNGPGKTLLVRTDMDALPVKEQTGLPYASNVSMKDDRGNEVPVMHACGHDLNMTCVIGASRVLANLKEQWHGTLIVIGQPAEERGKGARSMLKDGLFTRFPRPDFCLALHDDAETAAGSIAFTPGYVMANVDSVNVLIHGVGGHGAYPHKTKDPVLLAAQIILALQTIVSREIQPGEPAVVTVGSIHGGTKHNIIPDEVKLQLTVRSYTDEIRRQTLEAIKRIVRGQAIAAGLPEDRFPEVTMEDEFTPATYNSPELTERVASRFRSCFGEHNILRKKPSMGGEDFGEYGRTQDKIPIFMFFVGAVDPQKLSQKDAQPLPSLHSPLWAPSAEPAIKTGVTAMSVAVLDLLGTH